MAIRAVIERGPKDRKSAAYALDWPGWSRGGKTVDLAFETLAAYRDRYRKVVEVAGMESGFDAAGDLEIVEDHVGPGSTDFWGISFTASSFEQGPMPTEELERKLALLEACWAYFDSVYARVSPEMRKGPRGGGRDRDQIFNHTLGTERDFAKQIGVITAQGVQLTPEGRRQHRDNYVAAFREYNAEGKGAGRKSTLSFLLRHTAFHLLDHAWEMEDKDLSAS